MTNAAKTEATEIQVYYSAREAEEIPGSNGQCKMILLSELGEATPGSREAQEMIDRIVCRYTGQTVVAAESDVARTLEVGDVVSVDDDGMVIAD